MDVQYIAHLARLRLTSGEETKLGRQLGQILDYITKLNEVEVKGVEPTAHAFPLVNVSRKDEAHPSMPHEEAMKNAPSSANGLFMVPKIIE